MAEPTSIDSAKRRPRAVSSRVPPHNIEAEESLLGAMLLSQEAVAAAITDVRLSAADFYKPTHGHIYDAIVSLHSRGDAIDAVTVADELKRAGLHEQVGGVPALLSLEAHTPATTNAGRYARIIADHAVLYRMIGVAGEIAEMAYELPDDVPAAVDRAEGMIFGLTDLGRARKAETIGAGLEGWMDRLEDRFEHGTPAGIPTGWPDIDELLLGLHAGQLVTVAARPAMGKSSWAASLAVNVARTSRPVLFVSVEMGLAELQDRFVASTARINLQQLRQAKLNERDWPRLSNAIGLLHEIPLYIEDDPLATPMSIRGSARRIAARHNDLGLIVVDYLQLLTTTTRAENRQVEVADLSRSLKKLALELGVPVVALAQLNRGVETRKDKRPMLADLRESGAIENDSDVVAFLFREEYYDPHTPDRGLAEFIVAKQRNGPTDTVRLAYDARYGSWANLAKGGI